MHVISSVHETLEVIFIANKLREQGYKVYNQRQVNKRAGRRYEREYLNHGRIICSTTHGIQNSLTRKVILPRTLHNRISVRHPHHLTNISSSRSLNIRPGNRDRLLLASLSPLLVLIECILNTLARSNRGPTFAYNRI